MWLKKCLIKAKNAVQDIRAIAYLEDCKSVRFDFKMCDLRHYGIYQESHLVIIACYNHLKQTYIVIDSKTNQTGMLSLVISRLKKRDQIRKWISVSSWKIKLPICPLNYNRILKNENLFERYKLTQRHDNEVFQRKNREIVVRPGTL